MAHLGDPQRRSAQGPTYTRLKWCLHLAWHNLEQWLSVLIVIAAPAGWEWQAQTGRLSALFFPAPSAVAWTLVRLLASGELLSHLGVTLSRLILGFALGSVPGLILGLAMGWSRQLYVAINPLIAAVHPIPRIAVLPLILIIFGIGETSKVVVVAVAAFFPMLINSMAGVCQISPIYFEVAKNYGANPSKVFRRVVLPGSLPMVLTGARLALNVALLLTIAVELVAAQKGLGAMIWLAWETLRTEELYASLSVIAALGIGFNLILQRLESYFVPWHEKRIA